jgi:aldose 1-epimerase
MAQGYDVNFVLDGEAGTLRRAALLRAPDGARAMEVWTTEPGLQLYTGDNLGAIAGKRGATYGRFAGLCLETQHFPDSIHHQGDSDWPTIVLRPGEIYYHVTEYRFVLG